MARAAGAGVILVNGCLAAFLRRRNPVVRVFLPEGEPERSVMAREVAKKLAQIAIRRQSHNSGLLIGTINEVPAREHFLARFMEEAGFLDTVLGFQMRRVHSIGGAVAAPEATELAEDDEDDPEISESA